VADLDDVRDGIVAALRRQAAFEKATRAARNWLPPLPTATARCRIRRRRRKGTAASEKLAPFSPSPSRLEDGGAALAAAAFELAPIPTTA
jgi:hypothetical protein